MKIRRTLTADEQTALFRELRAAADPKRHPARERLIVENLPLVLKVWRETVPPTPQFVRHREDTRGVALLSLVNAVDGFDPAWGSAFGTYLGRVVKKEMFKYVLMHGGPVCIKHHAASDLMRARSGKRILRPRCHDAARRGSAPAGSGGELRLAARSGGTDEVDERDEAGAAARKLGVMFAALDRREAAVIRLRYPLDGGEPVTLREVGEAIGLTKERARQIEAVALRKMRAAACGG